MGKKIGKDKVTSKHVAAHTDILENLDKKYGEVAESSCSTSNSHVNEGKRKNQSYKKLCWNQCRKCKRIWGPIEDNYRPICSNELKNWIWVWSG